MAKHRCSNGARLDSVVMKLVPIQLTERNRVQKEVCQLKQRVDHSEQLLQAQTSMIVNCSKQQQAQSLWSVQIRKKLNSICVQIRDTIIPRVEMLLRNINTFHTFVALEKKSWTNSSKNGIPQGVGQSSEHLVGSQSVEQFWYVMTRKLVTISV